MKKIILSLISFIFIFSINIPSFAEVNKDSLSINSGACILVENSTDKIIYEKNSKEKMYPASTTKVMTALLALENCKLNDTTIVSRSAIKSISPEYATVYLNEGEELSIEQLLNILLIPSGNIAGNILAEHISGSYDKFVNLMNNRAKELGCVNTHFTNSYGLHDDNHYSCAYDLYLIAKEAMKYDTFRNIVNKTSYKLAPTNKYLKDDRTFYTTNDLIKPNASKRSDNYYYADAIGIKTGYTSQAKDCLIAAAYKDGLEFITVTLKGGKNSQGISDRYTDTKKLFDFAYNNYYLKTLHEANSIFKQITVKNGTSETKNLDLIIKDKITALVDKDSLYSTISPTTDIDEKNIEAPISKGDILGHITYNIDGIKYESEIIASHDVKQSFVLYIIISIGMIILIILIIVAIRILFKKAHHKKVKYTNYRI